MLKIRRPLGRLIFNMGIAIPGKTVFLIEMAPCNIVIYRFIGYKYGTKSLHEYIVYKNSIQPPSQNKIAKLLYSELWLMKILDQFLWVIKTDWLHRDYINYRYLNHQTIFNQDPPSTW